MHTSTITEKDVIEIRIPREISARFAAAVILNHATEQSQVKFAFEAFLRFDRSLPCWLLHKRPMDEWRTR
jgi:hypothetical protein